MKKISQRPNSASPRPSSTSSYQSDRGPRPGQDVCIGEEVRIAIHLAIERFRMNEAQKELEFPSSLTATERAYIHRYCDNLNLKHQSRGVGSNRFLTIFKREGNAGSNVSSGFQLMRNSRQQITSLLQRFPLSGKERQELLPRSDKNQPYDASKDLTKTTIGRLNNGLAQVPMRRQSTDLDSFRDSLPVSKYKDEIINTINNNRVTLISGETGSGKTTQVPQMILDDCFAKNRPCRIFCTQPRRIAALSVAERVANERGERIGQTVGYQIRLESKVSPKTLLTFCTNGVLLRTLMMSKNAMSTVTHVILDEVHERDRFSDFLITAVRDEMPKYGHFKIILMSAALNVDLFVKYFNHCPVINIPGNLFEVKEYFLEDVLKWTGFTNKKMRMMKTRKDKVAEQQEFLSDWCSKISISDSHTESHVLEFESKVQPDSMNTELVEEKEELEPWLVKEIEQLMSEVWLTGNDHAFSQIFHLMVTENVSVDYQHSETSLSCLMIAAARGFIPVVEQLLNLGANVRLRASNDWTAIDWAKKFNQTDIAELLESYIVEAETATLDTVDDTSAPLISEEDQELLSLYQHSFDDDKVDLDLVLALLIKILSSKIDGSVLIFLPGYDDIVTLRDRISGDKFFEKYRYIIFTLHSSMQSNDQRKVFKAAPSGVTKLILSTNIAETSITINDVVCVIDSGKVKEKTFDALMSMSQLKSVWISKASSLQRKGRAGRCRPGVCYHMFSRIRYSHMIEFNTPELLRFPLHEICLHTKLLAPTNCAIAEFLARAPEPPAYMITRNAVQLLKQIDALDKWEDLTEIGHHLADLPVDPRFGKMVLYSVVLKCLDPILTIVCTLAYKDPFLLPSMPYQKRAANASRIKFSADTFSDHMAFLRAFQQWQRARIDGMERTFCDKNYLSSACLEMILGMRTQLLGQLRASGFVRARGGGDIRDLNTNSENWAVVKAALCAGAYPFILKVDKVKGRIVSQKESNIKFHKPSVFEQPVLGTKAAIKNIPSEWIIYEEMSRANRFAMVTTCTAVASVSVALFAGPSKLAPDSVRNGETRKESLKSGITEEESSDSEEEEKDDYMKTTIQLDDWLAFKFDNETANLILQLRHKWNSLLIRRMRSPSKPWSQVDDAIVKTIVNVLTNEEQAMGFQQPAGIGQRPKPMSADSFVAVGNSGYMDYDDYSEGRGNNRGRKVPVTPPRRNYQFQPRTPRTPRTPGSKSDSNNSSPNVNNSKGSNSNTPCASPLTGAGDVSGKFSGPSRYYIMKCSNYKQLDGSMNKGMWPVSGPFEKKINKEFEEGKNIYLIFSVQGTGQFQGYARIISPVFKDSSPNSQGSATSSSFSIEWIKRGNLPYQNAQHLVNTWNDNKRGQNSKEGQELDPVCGEQLLKLWDRFPTCPRSPSASTIMKSPDKGVKTESLNERDENNEQTSESNDDENNDEDESPFGDDEYEEDFDSHTSYGGYERNKNSGHYYGRGHRQQGQGHGGYGYEGSLPGAYPYHQSYAQHQYYYGSQGGYYGNGRVYDQGYYPQHMGGQGFNPVYMGHMGMTSPQRHNMPPFMILQRGQGSRGHHRHYNHGYGQNH